MCAAETSAELDAVAAPVRAGMFTCGAEASDAVVDEGALPERGGMLTCAAEESEPDAGADAAPELPAAVVVALADAAGVLLDESGVAAG